MNTRRRHHYVPRFYLKRFADADEQLLAYERATGRHLRLAVRHAAVETDLYRVEPADKPVAPDAAEVIIADIEQELAPALDRLVSNGWPPDEDTRSRVANFVALQIARTREQMHAYRSLTDWTMKWQLSMLTPDAVRELLIGEGDSEQTTDEDVAEAIEAIMDFDDYQIEPHPNELMQNVFALASDLVEPIAYRHWVLLESDSPLFLTTDAPVHAWSPGSMPVGYLTAAELSIPMDPHHCLLMVLDGRGWPEARVPVPDRLAHETSHGLAHSSYEWVFAHPDSHILDRIDLPKGHRPLGYAGGEAMWRPGFDPRTD